MYPIKERLVEHLFGLFNTHQKLVLRQVYLHVCVLTLMCHEHVVMVSESYPSAQNETESAASARTISGPDSHISGTGNGDIQ